MPLIMPFSLRRRVRTAPPYTFHQGQRIRGREHDLVVLGAESIRHEAREAPLVVAGSVETDGEGLDRRCIRLARRTRSHGARVNTATDKPPDPDGTAEPPSYQCLELMPQALDPFDLADRAIGGGGQGPGPSTQGAGAGHPRR